jgi:ribosomal-protein-alanine N-acetyltransferase
LNRWLRSKDRGPRIQRLFDVAKPNSKRPSLRPSKLEDIDRLLTIESRCFRTHRFTRKDFEHHYRSPSSIFVVAELSDRVVGYIAGVIVRNASRSVAQIHSMAVMPAWRKHGIGSMLLEYFEQKAAEEDCQLVTLEVRRTNRSALALYRRFGYALEKVLKDYYAAGSDGLEMRKNLMVVRNG